MDGIIFFYIVLIVMVTIVKTFAKGKGKEAKSGSSGNHTPNRQQAQTTFRNINRKAGESVQRFKYQATHADPSYDDELLNYCDSHLSTARGITFRDVPPGQDELLYLRRYNHKREMELEKALQSAD